MSMPAIYSEVLDSLTNRWICEQSSTFEQVDDDYYMAPACSDFVVGDVLTGTVQSMLAMGAFAWESQVFDFCSNGFPPNPSRETHKLYKADRHTNYPGFRTRAELMQKASELLLLGTPASLKALSDWTRFLGELPNHDGDPTQQRIVYWFST